MKRTQSTKSTSAKVMNFFVEKKNNFALNEFLLTTEVKIEFSTPGKKIVNLHSSKTTFLKEISVASTFDVLTNANVCSKMAASLLFFCLHRN